MDQAWTPEGAGQQLMGFSGGIQLGGTSTEWGVAPAGSPWRPNAAQPSSLMDPAAHSLAAPPAFLCPKAALAQLQLLQQGSTEQSGGGHSSGGGATDSHSSGTRSNLAMAAPSWSVPHTGAMGPIMGHLVASNLSAPTYAANPATMPVARGLPGPASFGGSVTDDAAFTQEPPQKKNILSSLEVARALLDGIDSSPVYQPDDAMVRGWGPSRLPQPYPGDSPRPLTYVPLTPTVPGCIAGPHQPQGGQLHSGEPASRYVLQAPVPAAHCRCFCHPGAAWKARSHTIVLAALVEDFSSVKKCLPFIHLV